MSKPTAPIQEVSRLLDLVPYLSTHSHISLKELANEFGISERDMANELTALSMCGLPGYTPYELIEIFFDSGYVTINNHDALDIPRALTNLEVASLLIGLEILRDSLSADSEDGAQNEISKRIDMLTSQLSSVLGEVIEVHENPISSSSQLAMHAIASRKNLLISYLSSARDEVSERLIVPLSLYSENGHNYLSSFCTTSSGYRNFRLDRIIEMREAGDIDGQRPTQAQLPDISQIQVPVRIYGRRRDIAELFNLTSIPNDGRISLNSFSSAWVDRAVAAYSPDIEVQGPGEQRESTRAFLENILTLYRS